MILAWLLLLTGLTISAVAIYYSVVGLTAIFAAAALPIIVMGTTLEVAKLVCASWLKANWERVPFLMKSYMTVAVAVLMLITSMGIFGFLSKAHMDQTLVSGDVQSRISIIDEKIKTEKDNIESAKKALTQMDAAVDQTMARSTNEAGAGRAAQLRRTQAKERATLQADITKSQKIISALNDEAAPIRAEVRKVEAEVGPIKYIAALVYGNTADTNLLEKAVTWVIITIVIVFDPLAIIMLLAAQMSFGWKRKNEPAYEPDDGPLTDEQVAQIRKFASKDLPSGKVTTKEELFTTTEQTHTGEVPSNTPSTALGGDITAPEEPEVPNTSESELEKWNKMIQEAEKEISKETEIVQGKAVEAELVRGEDLLQAESKKKSYMTKDQLGKIQIKNRQT
jgi:hypothetical protein